MMNIRPRTLADEIAMREAARDPQLCPLERAVELRRLYPTEDALQSYLAHAADDEYADATVASAFG